MLYRTFRLAFRRLSVWRIVIASNVVANMIANNVANDGSNMVANDDSSKYAKLMMANDDGNFDK